MKLVEDTPQQIVVTSRRKIVADVIFVFFLGFGVLFASAMAREDMRDFINVAAIFLALFFAGIGIWGLLYNASDHVTFDAPTRTLTIKRRRLMRTRIRTIPFASLKDISVHRSDDMHTVVFRLTDGEDVLLETTYSGNPQAAPLARHLREWFQAHRLS